MKVIIVGSFPSHLLGALVAQGIEVRPRENSKPLGVFLRAPTFREDFRDRHPNDSWRGRGKQSKPKYK